jgi:hypothetical protein
VKHRDLAPGHGGVVLDLVDLGLCRSRCLNVFQ